MVASCYLQPHGQGVCFGSCDMSTQRVYLGTCTSACCQDWLLFAVGDELATGHAAMAAVYMHGCRAECYMLLHVDAS